MKRLDYLIVSIKDSTALAVHRSNFPALILKPLKQYYIIRMKSLYVWSLLYIYFTEYYPRLFQSPQRILQHVFQSAGHVENVDLGELQMVHYEGPCGLLAAAIGWTLPLFNAGNK